jgi:O-methyltransferase
MAETVLAKIGRRERSKRSRYRPPGLTRGYHTKVSLTGTQQTALVTLYGKALDSCRPDPILGDREADRAVRRLDYDFSTLHMRRRDQQSSALRSKAYDAG